MSGYRLTPEEEALIKNSVLPPTKTGDEKNGSPARKGMTKSVWTLGIIVLLFIGLSYAAFYLLTSLSADGRKTASETSTGNADAENETVPIRDITQDKKAFFIEKLQLTKEEETAFWPLYLRFHEEKNLLAQKKSRLLSANTPANDDTATFDAFINTYTSIYQDVIFTTKTYAKEFAELLGRRRAQMFFIIDENLTQNPH